MARTDVIRCGITIRIIEQDDMYECTIYNRNSKISFNIHEHDGLFIYITHRNGIHEIFDWFIMCDVLIDHIRKTRHKEIGLRTGC